MVRHLAMSAIVMAFLLSARPAVAVGAGAAELDAFRACCAGRPAATARVNPAGAETSEAGKGGGRGWGRRMGELSPSRCARYEGVRSCRDDYACRSNSVDHAADVNRL